MTHNRPAAIPRWSGSQRSPQRPASGRQVEGGSQLRSDRSRAAHERAPGKVEVIEVFWLGCPHCYALEPYVEKWLKTKPTYITFVRVPVMWGPVHQAHARLYYTLVELHRADLFEKAFDTIQREQQSTGREHDGATLNLGWPSPPPTGSRRKTSPRPTTRWR